MAQQVDGGGKTSFRTVAFWPPNQAKPQLLWKHWKQRFHWALVAKHVLVSSNYYFDATLTETQITAPGDVGGKSSEEGERTFISNLNLDTRDSGHCIISNHTWIWKRSDTRNF